MSATPSSMQFVPPPLPPGWTEHQGPANQRYYYNTRTQESTYVRPLPVPVPPQPAKKKEKPVLKTPIPGTEWLRVKTTEGNIFYSHKTKKDSVWTVPDEIRDALNDLEKDEEESRFREEKEAKEKGLEAIRQAERERLLEIERIRSEVQDMVKRKAETETPVDEVIVSKKARVEEVDDDSDSDEEEWQKEAATQLAAEAQEEKKRQEEEAERVKQEAEIEAKKVKETQVNMPEKVDLSAEETKALFKTLLREKDINPLHPWDTSLPLFVSDPRYVLLPSVSSRKDAFDEYCRDRARELRQMNVKKETEAANPKDVFNRLLKEEVKSTRSSWNEFRRAWKKDRRFYGWGRDDKERERRFREYIKELGEKKREAAQKAETDFFTLLRESSFVKPDSTWKDIKRKLVDDPRYDVVGSSTLREELFNAFIKAQESTSQGGQPAPKETAEDETADEVELDRRRREKKERAVREREEKVRAERNRLEIGIGKSRMELNREEDEQEFRTMLTDAIRDAQANWDVALPQLMTDPRFNRSSLSSNQQLHLFHAHVEQLRSKHRSALQTLFESYAPSLATKFSELPTSSLRNSSPVTKLGLSTSALEHEFSIWQRQRYTDARKAFDEMLAENSFVEFWGRLGKIGGEGVDGGVKQDDDTPEDEGEGGGGRVDMKALAKNVDIGDMEKVLKNDKRYIVFGHIPDEREKWLRNYLSQLEAPKLSVH